MSQFCMARHPDLYRQTSYREGDSDPEVLTCECHRLAGHTGEHAGYFFHVNTLVRWPGGEPDTDGEVHDLDYSAFGGSG